MLRLAAMNSSRLQTEFKVASRTSNLHSLAPSRARKVQNSLSLYFLLLPSQIFPLVEFDQEPHRSNAEPIYLFAYGVTSRLDTRRVWRQPLSALVG